MNPAIALALLAVAGLLATRLPSLPMPGSALIALPLRVLRAGGIPLALVGLVLGPGINLLDHRAFVSFAPLVALAVGWVAAAFGARWEWRVVRRIGGRRAVLLVSGAAAALLVVSLAGWIATRVLPGVAAAWLPLGPTVMTLAALAAVSGPDAIQMLARTVGVPRRTARALYLAALLEAGAGTIVIALTIATTHPRHAIGGAVGGVLVWLALAVGAGAVTALVFVWLTRPAPPHADVPLALLAALIVGAGLGWAAGLSPFVVCAVAGALLVNVSVQRRRVQAVLAAWEPTLVGVLAVAAGALLAVPTPWLLVAIALLAAARIAGKWGGMRAALLSEEPPVLPLNAGLALVVQGGVVVAMSVNFLLMHGGTSQPGAGGAFLTAAIVGLALAQAAAVPLLGPALAPSSLLTPGPQVSDLSAGSPAA